MKNTVFSCMLLTLITSQAFAQENLVKEEPMPKRLSATDTSEPATPVAQGTRYACENNGNVRRVEIEYETASSTLPCSVNYYKDNEAPGQNTTLWRAEKAEGFCESKAAEMVDRLRNFGWECTES